MSKFQMQKIHCPACGREAEIRVWDNIDTGDDPEMKEKVRTNEAFLFHCACGVTVPVYYPFLYHEPAARLVIFCAEGGADYSPLKEIFTDRTGPFAAYTCRVTKNHNEFQEKLFILDAGLSDKLVEIMKNGIYTNLDTHYKDRDIDEVLFAVNDEGEKGFLFRKEGEMVSAMEFDQSLYDALKEKALPQVEAMTAGDFLIDKAWAADIVSRL